MAGRARSTRAGHGPWRRTASGTTGLVRNALAPAARAASARSTADIASTGAVPSSGEPAAELEPATGDHEIDDRQFWPTIGEQLLGERWVERRTHLVALGPQEVLEQFGRVPVAFGEQDDDRGPARIGAARDCPHRGAVRQAAGGRRLRWHRPPPRRRGSATVPTRRGSRCAGRPHSGSGSRRHSAPPRPAMSRSRPRACSQPRRSSRSAGRPTHCHRRAVSSNRTPRFGRDQRVETR